MSKNITISEGSQAKNFNNVAKIRTNVIGGGTQNWIPEDEAADYADLGAETFDENGTYFASDSHLDGFNQVTVNVQPDLTDAYITENGTYYARNDGADGYSKVEVNVTGGGGINIHGQEMRGMANTSIQAGDTVYIQATSGDVTELVAPTGIADLDYPILYYNGYIYYNRASKRVPYSNLTATPENTNYLTSLDMVGGQVGGRDGSIDGSLWSLSTSSIVSDSALYSYRFIRTANHRVSYRNSVYDENLNLLATCRETGYPLPNNTLVRWVSNSSKFRVSSPSTNAMLDISGGTPTEEAQVLDYRYYTYTIDGSGNSTGNFGYYDFYGVQDGDVVAFHKICDCYAGSNPSSHIKVRISNNHDKITVKDTQYGIRIITASGGCVTYSSIPHTDSNPAYLVGDLLFNNGHVYRLTSSAIMGKTSSKNFEYLGVCKYDVAANEMGTAIILFS